MLAFAVFFLSFLSINLPRCFRTAPAITHCSSFVVPPKLLTSTATRWPGFRHKVEITGVTTSSTKVETGPKGILRVPASPCTPTPSSTRPSWMLNSCLDAPGRLHGDVHRPMVAIHLLTVLPASATTSTDLPSSASCPVICQGTGRATQIMTAIETLRFDGNNFISIPNQVT